MGEAEISTARAVEILLAKVPMHYSLANEMRALLAQERAKTPRDMAPIADDVAGGIHEALWHLHGIDETFPKRAMLCRIDEARRVLLAMPPAPRKAADAANGG